MEWISVKIRLPELDRDVLVYHQNVQHVGYYAEHEGDYYWYSFDTGILEDEREPTHWMPLPEPPKQEE